MSAAVQVPIITQRKRIPAEAIQDVVNQIVSRFRPQKIILFGSYAYGIPRPESDVDLLVVMETDKRETQQAVEVLKSIEYNFGLDLIVITPGRLAQRLEMGDWFLKEITRRGIVVYEASGS